MMLKVPINSTVRWCPSFVSEEAGCGLKQRGMGPTDTPEVLFVKIARKSHFIVGWEAGWGAGVPRVLKACCVPSSVPDAGFGRAKGHCPCDPSRGQRAEEMARQGQREVRQAGPRGLFQTRKGFPEERVS